MTPVEIAAWISDLAPSNEQRIKVLVDLIDNAGKDHMSAEDRGICVAELSRLESVQQCLLLTERNLT